jgi:ribosomal protein S18 acetylase RimI-like enzyme
MTIRKARIEDAKVIATYLMLAMKEIVYRFIGEDNEEKATCFLEGLISKKSNQYSYENCWVIESEKSVIAVANVYDGSDLQELIKPVAEAIKSMFGRDFNPEEETQSGELYLDCLGVNPNQQGKGIGSTLLDFLIEEYVAKRGETLGLLVEKDNPNAKRLYLKLGFEIIGEKVFVGKRVDHLQIQPNSYK